MAQIEFEQLQLYFITDREKVLLLDFLDTLKNKSRVPLLSLADNQDLMYEFITYLKQKNEMLFPEHTVKEQLTYLTINCLMIQHLIKSAAPIKVAELGCTNGKLSYNLTELIGKLNPKSALWLISNTIGSDSGNNCLNLITQAEHSPELSMTYCDYAETLLADNTFDIVVLNGEIDFEDPYQVIREALRITKENGILICYSPANYLLESSFKLVFSNRQEYSVSPSDCIMIAQKDCNYWEGITTPNSLDGFSELMEQIKSELSENDNITAYRAYIKQLDCYIDKMIAEYNIPKKVYFIELKNALLDYITAQNSTHHDFYKAELLSYLQFVP